MHLRQPGFIDLASRLVGVPVVGAPTRRERTEESLRLHDLPEAAQAAQGPFFFDEEGGVDLAGRIIQCHDQVPLTTGNPFIGRAVLMQHHAGQRFAGPLLPVGPASGRSGHVSCGLQSLLRPTNRTASRHARPATARGHV